MNDINQVKSLTILSLDFEVHWDKDVDHCMYSADDQIFFFRIAGDYTENWVNITSAISGVITILIKNSPHCTEDDHSEALADALLELTPDIEDDMPGPSIPDFSKHNISQSRPQVQIGFDLDDPRDSLRLKIFANMDDYVGALLAVMDTWRAFKHDARMEDDKFYEGNEAYREKIVEVLSSLDFDVLEQYCNG